MFGWRWPGVLPIVAGFLTNLLTGDHGPPAALLWPPLILVSVLIVWVEYYRSSGRASSSHLVSCKKVAVSHLSWPGYQDTPWVYFTVDSSTESPVACRISFRNRSRIRWFGRRRRVHSDWIQLLSGESDWVKKIDMESFEVNFKLLHGSSVTYGPKGVAVGLGIARWLNGLPQPGFGEAGCEALVLDALWFRLLSWAIGKCRIKLQKMAGRPGSKLASYGKKNGESGKIALSTDSLVCCCGLIGGGMTLSHQSLLPPYK